MTTQLPTFLIDAHPRYGLGPGLGLRPLAGSPDGHEIANEAVEATVDVASILGFGAAGALVGLLVAVGLLIALRAVLYRHKPGRLLVHRLRFPVPFVGIIAGLSVGLELGVSSLKKGQYQWVAILQHGILLAVIGAITWSLVAAVHVIEDIAQVKYGSSDESNARRVTTQTQVLRRVLQAVVVILGLIVALLTFPSARTAMTALLSSAGIISIVAGIAAQSVLGNMFAGLQVAFTDSIRVGDILEFDDEYGTVEEITLTYVVMRIWNDRRLVIPTKQLTEKTFRNWTKRHAQVLGTVELPLDWDAPVGAMRLELGRLLAKSGLWDGHTGAISVTESRAGEICVRICVSAATPSELWDLRCYLREHMVRWVVENAPYALARRRVAMQEVERVERRETDEQVVALAEELVELSHPQSPEEAENIESTAEMLAQAQVSGKKPDPVIAAKIKALFKRERRKRQQTQKRQADLDRAQRHLEKNLERTQDHPDRTDVISAAELAKYIESEKASPRGNVAAQDQAAQTHRAEDRPRTQKPAADSDQN